MAKNKNLHQAKKAKNDEFYTRLEDIEKELCHYREHFKDKIVLCNCDDPRESKFFTYFSLNFEFLGLKRLICIGYKENGHGVKYVYDGDKNKNGVVDSEEIEVVELEGNGDFRNRETIEILKECDVVVTNPPFSLFREYVAQLMEYNKKFLIIGNMNAITYKEVFPLIKENKIWLGFKSCSGGMDMVPPNFNPTECKKYKIIKGVPVVNIMGCIWFTNLDHTKRHENIILYKKYNIEEYPKYDNYNAINVNKVSDIPCDYEGVMGVPITFLDKYNPEQFEIVEFRKGNDGKDLVYSTNGGGELSHTLEYSSVNANTRINEQPQGYQSEWEKYVCQNTYSSTSVPGMIKNAEGKINGKPTYARILIKKIK